MNTKINLVPGLQFRDTETEQIYTVKSVNSAIDLATDSASTVVAFEKVRFTHSPQSILAYLQFEHWELVDDLEQEEKAYQETIDSFLVGTGRGL